MSQASLRKFRFAPCGADLFADPGAGYIYPMIESVDVGAEVKTYERPFLVQDHEHFGQIVGERTGDLKFTTEAKGFGGAPAGAGSGIAASDGENGALLKTVFGSQTKDTGSVTAAGTTASLIKVASTALLSVGGFVGLVDPATGLYHARQIRSKTATDLTIDRALPFTPAVGATVYASSSFTHAISGHQHLFFDVEGFDPTAAKGWRRSYFGCLGDFALKNTSALGRLLFDWTMKALYWDDPNQGNTQPAPTYPASLPSAGAFIRNTRISLGANGLIVSEFGFELGNDIQGKVSTAAPNGITQFFVVGAKQTASFKVAVDDAHAANIFVDSVGQNLDLLVEMTQGGPGNSFAIAGPVAQIVSVKPATVNGLDYYDVALALNRTSLAGISAVTFGIL